jgi:peptidoglycan/xylan/chitin deacetylase (PgdA/CDA1 family)
MTHASSSLPRLTARTAAGLAAGVVAHLLPGVVAWRSMRCRLLPRLSGVGDPGHVAITFDDGPDPKSTPPILDALDALGWRATFFCLGIQVRRSPDLAQELVRRGHEMAVHGDEHRSHLRRPFTSTVPDLLRARDTVEEVTGQEVRWFRPPYGAVSSATLVAAQRSGLQLILWTTWGLDWQPRATGRTVAANVARTFRPGATVLLHDSDIHSIPGTWRSTLSALPILGRHWAAAGLQVGTLGEHGVAEPGRRADGRAGGILRSPRPVATAAPTAASDALLAPSRPSR